MTTKDASDSSKSKQTANSQYQDNKASSSKNGEHKNMPCKNSLPT